MQRIRVFRTAVFAAVCLCGMVPCSCRAPLYYAARNGDTAAVQEELYRGADPQAKPSPAHLAWQLPAALAALPADAVQLPLFSLTGGYFGTTDWNDCSLVRRALFFGSKTPREAAMERGHFEVAQLLSDNRAMAAPECADGLCFRFSLRKAKATGHAYSAFGNARESRSRSAYTPLRTQDSAVYNGMVPADCIATCLNFEADNRAPVVLCPQGAEEHTTAEYTRTGSHTARISLQAAAVPCTYSLIFTGPRSGTAVYEYGGLDAGEQFFIRMTGIEFSAEAAPLPAELTEPPGR